MRRSVSWWVRPSVLLLLPLLLLLLFPVATAADLSNDGEEEGRNLTFALINSNHFFYEPVKLGWEYQCNKIPNLNCLYYELNDNEDDNDNDNQDISIQEKIHEVLSSVLEDDGIELDGIAAHFDTDPRLLENQRLVFEKELGVDIPIVHFGDDPYIPNTHSKSSSSTTTSTTTFGIATSRTMEEGTEESSALPLQQLPQAYIGTDQRFMGRTMARMLKQLRPEGGTYVIIAPPAQSHLSDQRIAGFTSEIAKINRREDKVPFYRIHYSYYGSLPRHVWEDPLQLMDYLAQRHDPTAFIMTYPYPMQHVNWTQFVDTHRHITYVCTDITNDQLEYLNRRYVDGLVGQMPYEMGTKSVNALWELVWNGTTAGNTNAKQQQQQDDNNDRMFHNPTFIPTNLVQYNLMPLELPKVQFDSNLIGNLVYVGYICFGVVALTAMTGIVWTIYHRQAPVVTAAQPFFLVMTASGILIMAGALIPLTFDDDGDADSLSPSESVWICMSVPWLAFLGFTVTFSALFSKTWRVNQMFHSKQKYGRVNVGIQDVLMPFGVLLTCNIVVLTCWTIFDPLTYVRQLGTGTDFWNREFESVGTCTSDNVLPYALSLGLINFCVLLNAIWQAFRARGIESEFSEATYIALAVYCMFQAFSTGVPLVILSRDIPQVFYLILTLLITILCMAILILIFLPKFAIQRRYSQMSEADQRKMILISVRKSSLQESSLILQNLDGSSVFPGGMSSHTKASSTSRGGGGGGGGSNSNSIRGGGSGLFAKKNNTNNNSNHGGSSAFMAPPPHQSEDPNESSAFLAAVHKQAIIPEVEDEWGESNETPEKSLSTTGAAKESSEASTVVAGNRRCDVSSTENQWTSNTSSVEPVPEEAANQK